MVCFYPLKAWQTDDGAVVFAERGKVRRSLTLPCGQCRGCRLERSRQWAIRCVHEAQLHDSNAFVTLTYDNEHVPSDGSLRYVDFQRFMRKLRKRFGSVRFYMCGEYGETTFRPHYHALLFGLDLFDKKPIGTTPSGFPLWRSPMLESIWEHGYSSFGDVTFESAAYVSRYVMKKVTGPNADEHYTRVSPHTGEIVKVTPEFTRMSLKPGIGAPWLERFASDVLTCDQVSLRGRKMKPPRYYDNKLREQYWQRFEEIDLERFQKAMDMADDNTPERLVVREQVLAAGLNFKRRGLE